MAALTVTLSEIQAIRPVASNIGTATGSDRIGMYIQEARVMDLQPSLTADLLYKIDNDATTYQTLIDGGSYEYNDKRYTFLGLKKALAYFVYARMVKSNQVNVTAFGVVNKTDPNSETADYRMVAKLSNDAYDIGVAYLADCMDYVKRLFDTQETSELTDQKKFGISAIGD